MPVAGYPEAKTTSCCRLLTGWRCNQSLRNQIDRKTAQRDGAQSRGHPEEQTVCVPSDAVERKAKRRQQQQLWQHRLPSRGTFRSQSESMSQFYGQVIEVLSVEQAPCTNTANEQSAASNTQAAVVNNEKNNGTYMSQSCRRLACCCARTGNDCNSSSSSRSSHRQLRL